MDNKTLLPGTTLKGSQYTYKIEKVLGQGTFGITYLATTYIKVDGALGSLQTKIQVAIKEFFMRDINGRNENTVTCSNNGGLYVDYKHKFAKEAENLSNLNHKGVVKVLERFETNNTIYYSMEFCEGGSLNDYIEKAGKLSEEDTLEYTKQIAEALRNMHEKKMLHLDLKPANIMLRANGELVLIDFGLSKQYDENGQPESSTNIGGGTPGYAPLEQANYNAGAEFPMTMDIYALGACMFKMLTGERPDDASVIFNEGFPTEKLKEHNVSDQTIELITKLMSPAKRQRPQDVKTLLALLNKDHNYNSKNIKEENTIFDTTQLIKEKPKEVQNINKSKQETLYKKTQQPQKTPKEESYRSLWKGIICGVGIIILLLISLKYVVNKDTRNNQQDTENHVKKDTGVQQYDETAENEARERIRKIETEKRIKNNKEEERKQKLIQNKKRKEKKEQTQSKKPTNTNTQTKNTTETSEFLNDNNEEEEFIVEETIEEETIFQVVEQQPEFPGGTKALMRYLSDNIKYPRISRDNNSQGKSFINFVVNSDGSIQNVTVLRSSGDIHLDNEAVRVVSSMPKWNPGKQQGKAVRVRFILPVVFRLQGAAKNNELLPPLKRAESTTTHELQSVKGRKGKIKELQDELQRKDIIIKDI